VNNPLPTRDADYFQELQTQTGWGRTLDSFARWCDPKPGWLTLDVGCGPGLLPAKLSKLGCADIGVDLDRRMFDPAPLHPIVVVADIHDLPYKNNIFNLITCSNLLFMLNDPIQALAKMGNLLTVGGKLAMLNPSELFNEQAALVFATEKQLDGIARDTLIQWARRAEAYYHWTEKETAELYRQAGLNYGESILKVGPGFGRFSWGMK
jgi:SAM-dependent methyltransferase